MAGKRIAIRGIDWAKIAERVPEHEKPKFVAFRARSDAYLRRMNANPESPPKIDWALYKKVVPIPGMVDTFQKQYEGFQIPYPQNTLSSLIDAQESEVKKEIEDFKTASSARIKKHEAEIARINSLLPYDQMTLEEFSLAHPEQALDPLNKPTFWPHTPEEQLDYQPPNPGADAKH